VVGGTRDALGAGSRVPDARQVLGRDLLLRDPRQRAPLDQARGRHPGRALVRRSQPARPCSRRRGWWCSSGSTGSTAPHSVRS
jgi:hypothetical protein